MELSLDLYANFKTFAKCYLWCVQTETWTFQGVRTKTRKGPTEQQENEYVYLLLIWIKGTNLFQKTGRT